MSKITPVTSVLVVVMLSGCAARTRHVNTAATTSPAARLEAARAGATTTSAPSPLEAFFDRAGGPGGGWIVGAREELVTKKDLDAASKANTAAAQTPATVADVGKSPDADLNHDGFVTVDELLAMKRAGLNDRQMIERIQSTNQIFSLNARKQQYLLDRGLDHAVIDGMLSLQPSAAVANARAE
jgi:hypothetical protein